MIDWKTVKEYEDITYKKCGAVARIAINRPEVRNAFRPKTTSELYDAFYHVSEDSSWVLFCSPEKGQVRKTAVMHFAAVAIKKRVVIKVM